MTIINDHEVPVFSTNAIIKKTYPPWVVNNVYMCMAEGMFRQFNEWLEGHCIPGRVLLNVEVVIGFQETPGLDYAMDIDPDYERISGYLIVKRKRGGKNGKGL